MEEEKNNQELLEEIRETPATAEEIPEGEPEAEVAAEETTG